MEEILIDRSTTLFWFRRDLRLEDNAGLYQALRSNANVLPVFIFDTQILNSLDDKIDKRVEFIYQSVVQLKNRLEQMGSSLFVLHGNPVELLKALTPKCLYANHDYEPYARNRDSEVLRELSRNEIPFFTFKDQVIFERDEILKEDGAPYTIFTPYSKKWKSRLSSFHSKAYPVEKYFFNLKRTAPLPFPSLRDLAFHETGANFPTRSIKVSIIERYHQERNYPGIQGTTRLSVHLRFGTVSLRKLVRLAIEKNETWLNELIWRDFYHMILWHFPRVEKAFKPAYDNIAWRNDPNDFQLWCEGKTGYPLVDAGMRELNETGFMHNRIRMVVASFLTKHLLIDWRWGEAYFAAKLLDFDLAANNGGWQWASGSGCDAAPYFRIFNPEIQRKKFDPDWTYVNRWVPELNTGDYPAPIIDHAFARERALAAYKRGLG